MSVADLKVGVTAAVPLTRPAIGAVPYKALRRLGEWENDDQIEIFMLGRRWHVLAVAGDGDVWHPVRVVAASIKPADASIECAWIPVEVSDLPDDAYEHIESALMGERERSREAEREVGLEEYS